jgi:hypothetical protein
MPPATLFSEKFFYRQPFFLCNNFFRLSLAGNANDAEIQVAS